MKNAIFAMVMVVAGWASVGHAENPPISYSATCNGRGFSMKPVTIQWEGSFTGPTTS